MPTDQQKENFESFKTGLRASLGPAVFDSYFATLQLSLWAETEVWLRAKNRFSANLITDKYRQPIWAEWERHCGPVDLLQVEGADEPIATHRAMRGEPRRVPTAALQKSVPALKEDLPVIESRITAPAPAAGRAAAMKAPAPDTEDMPECAGNGTVNPWMTLERFCVNDTNRLARQAVTRLLEGASTPITYVHGHTGRGKSHLLNAAAMEWMRRCPDARVMYIPYDSLISDVVEAHISSSAKQLRQFLRNTDILIFDDVHMLRGRKRTQEELACLLERLQQVNKPSLLAGALNPSELAATGISSRLADRLAGGVHVSIDAPDMELRLRVAKQIATDFNRRTGLDIPLRHIDLIARRCDGSMRELQGAVHTFALEVESYRPGASGLTDTRAQALIDELLAHRRNIPTLESIFDLTADVFGVSQTDLRSRSRKSQIVRARHAFCMLSRRLTDSPLTAIGGMVQRDHTTIMNAIKKAEIFAESDTVFGERISRIMAEFGKA